MLGKMLLYCKLSTVYLLFITAHVFPHDVSTSHVYRNRLINVVLLYRSQIGLTVSGLAKILTHNRRPKGQALGFSHISPLLDENIAQHTCPINKHVVNSNLLITSRSTILSFKFTFRIFDTLDIVAF